MQHVSNVPLNARQIVGSRGQAGVLGGDLGFGLGGREQPDVIRSAVEHVAYVADVTVRCTLGFRGVGHSGHEDCGCQGCADRDVRFRHVATPWV